MSYLLVVEGLDACGKSTVVAAAAAELAKRNVPTAIFAHPAKTGPIGGLIRQAFTGEIKLEPTTMVYLMMGDAIECERQIQIELRAGKVVLLDRHTLASSFVYQTETLPLNLLLQIVNPERFQRPDATFILDVPVDVAIGRMQGRGGKDSLYENVDKAVWETRRNKYVAYQFLNHTNTLLLDGQQKVENNVNVILNVLDQLQTQRLKKN